MDHQRQHHAHHHGQDQTTPTLPSRRRLALEGAAAVSTSPLVVGPGGLALLSLGGATATATGTPERMKRSLGGISGIDSPVRGSSPLSSYTLRVMRERAAAAATASEGTEEKGEFGVVGATASTTRRSSAGGSVDGMQRLLSSSLSYAASPTVSSPSKRAAVIRSVDDDEDQGQASAACSGPAHSHPQHEEAPVSSESGPSPSMCCRNCGSSAVVETVPLNAASPSKKDGGGPSSSSGTMNSTAALRAASLASGLPVSTCKLLVVGNAKCGKTSVIRRFVQGSFQNAYVSTVGADYLKRDVVLQDGRPVRLQLWDIAGQDRFVHLTRAYFARARGVLLVCDLTRETTFEAVRAWKREIDEWALTEMRDGMGPLPVVLIANKCDMLTDPADSFLAGANMVAMCHEQKFASWYVTSARTGSNVEAAFLDLVERAVAFMDQQEEAAAAAVANGGSSGFKLSSTDGSQIAGSGSGGRAWTMC